MSIADIEAKYQVHDDDPILVAAMERTKDRWFAEGIECYERNGEPTELWNDTQRDGYTFAAGLADNSPTFEFDFDVVAADVAAMSEGKFMHFLADEMRAGRVLTAVQFEEMDEQIGVYEECNRWQW